MKSAPSMASCYTGHGMGSERERLLEQARGLVAQHDLDRALLLYRELCEDDPYDPDPWMERAGVAESLGLIGEAVRSLFHVAELYARTGMGEAVEIAQRVLALEPGHPGARQFLRPHASAAPGPAVSGDLGDADAVPVMASRFDAIPVAMPLADALPMPIPVSESVAMPRPVLEALSGAVSAPVSGFVSGAISSAGATSGATSGPVPRSGPVSGFASGPVPGSVSGQLSDRISDQSSGRMSGPVSGPVSELADPDAAPRPPGARTRRLVTELVRNLRTSALVQELDADAISFLVEAGHPRRCVRGQVVFREGEEGASMFLVLQGSVDVERRSATGSVVRLSTLPPGAFFGEISVMAGVPRSATVRAREQTILLEVSRDSMRELGRRHEQVLVTLMRFFRARLVGTVMATSPLFQPFSPDERRALVSRFRLRELGPDEIVVRQGRTGDGLYVVLIGTLVAFVTDDSGNTRKLGVLEPGEIFGEMSLIHDARAMASIGTYTRCWLLRLPREDFADITAMHPEVLDQLARIAADREARNRDTLADELSGG